MPGANLSVARRLAALLLVASFLVFAVGAVLPDVGEHGNREIFTLPLQEHLLAVAENPVAWRWANVAMGAAVVAWVAGLTVLTTILEGAGEPVLSRLGLVGSLMAAVIWLIFSAFRAVVTVAAARETAATGVVPAPYAALADWMFALFGIYAIVGFLALASYGGSMLRVGLLPAWVGWTTILFSLAMGVLLLIVGDTLPAFHYFPPLLIGIMLLVRRKR
jgi:hypothetical protein